MSRIDWCPLSVKCAVFISLPRSLMVPLFFLSIFKSLPASHSGTPSLFWTKLWNKYIFDLKYNFLIWALNINEFLIWQDIPNFHMNWTVVLLCIYLISHQNGVFSIHIGYLSRQPSMCRIFLATLLKICIFCATLSSTWSNTRHATPHTTRLSQQSASGPSTRTALPLEPPSTRSPSLFQKTWGTCECVLRCHLHPVNRFIWIDISTALSLRKEKKNTWRIDIFLGIWMDAFTCLNTFSMNVMFLSCLDEQWRYHGPLLPNE